MEYRKVAVDIFTRELKELFCARVNRFEQHIKNILKKTGDNCVKYTIMNSDEWMEEFKKWAKNIDSKRG